MTTLTPEACDALRAQLARVKKRDDVEVLGVTGVWPEWVQDWFGSVPGLVFEVDFTFTSRRRRRSHAQVAFRTHNNGGSRSDYASVEIPPALLEFLNNAVTTDRREN